MLVTLLFKLQFLFVQDALIFERLSKVIAISHESKVKMFWRDWFESVPSLAAYKQWPTKNIGYLVWYLLLLIVLRHKFNLIKANFTIKLFSLPNGLDDKRKRMTADIEATQMWKNFTSSAHYIKDTGMYCDQVFSSKYQI